MWTWLLWYFWLSLLLLFVVVVVVVAIVVVAVAAAAIDIADVVVVVAIGVVVALDIEVLLVHVIVVVVVIVLVALSVLHVKPWGHIGQEHVGHSSITCARRGGECYNSRNQILYDMRTCGGSTSFSRVAVTKVGPRFPQSLHARCSVHVLRLISAATLYMAHACITMTEIPEHLHVPIPTVPLLPGLFLADYRRLQIDSARMHHECYVPQHEWYTPMCYTPYAIHSQHRQASTEVKRRAKHGMAWPIVHKVA